MEAVSVVYELIENHGITGLFLALNVIVLYLLYDMKKEVLEIRNDSKNNERNLKNMGQSLKDHETHCSDREKLHKKEMDQIYGKLDEFRNDTKDEIRRVHERVNILGQQVGDNNGKLDVIIKKMD